jgi:hypothetical protein
MSGAGAWGDGRLKHKNLSLESSCRCQGSFDCRGFFASEEPSFAQDDSFYNVRLNSGVAMLSAMTAKRER